jgi:hypothetical protein
MSKLPEDEEFVSLGARLTRTGAAMEMNLLASMTMTPKPALAIASAAGIRGAIFQDDAARLIFNGFVTLDQLHRLTGEHERDRLNLFALLCRGIEQIKCVRWISDPTWGESWTFGQRWRQLTHCGQWSPTVLTALFVCYHQRPVAVADCAKRLVEFHQRTADGIRHILAGRQIIIDQIGRNAA